MRGDLSSQNALLLYMPKDSIKVGSLRPGGNSSQSILGWFRSLSTSTKERAKIGKHVVKTRRAVFAGRRNPGRRRVRKRVFEESSSEAVPQ